MAEPAIAQILSARCSTTFACPGGAAADGCAVMPDADDCGGGTRMVPVPPAPRQAASAWLQVAEEAPMDADRLSEPARGMVLGLAPAALLWVALIAAATKLLR